MLTDSTGWDSFVYDGKQGLRLSFSTGRIGTFPLECTLVFTRVLNLKTCHVMKAEALASGVGVRACRFETRVSGSGRREWSTGSFVGRNSKLSVDCGDVGVKEGVKESRGLVSRAIDRGKDVAKNRIIFEKNLYQRSCESLLLVTVDKCV